jgi:hypothetical protein
MPKLRIVYVVSANVGSAYLSMTRISIQSLRITNSGCYIILAIDTASLNMLRISYHPLLKEVDEILEVDVDHGDNKFLSRYIKTKVASIIIGPILFIDSDTVVRGRLNIAPFADCDISAARNHSRYKYEEQLWKEDQNVSNSMGWKVPTSNYYNTGVLYFNGSEKSKKFSEMWHMLWQDGVMKTGNHADQPSFNSLVASEQFKVGIMPNVWNAQVLSRLYWHKEFFFEEHEDELEKGALIWHFLSSGNAATKVLAFDRLVEKMRSSPKVPMKDLIKLIKSEHPWNTSSFLDEWVARYASKTSRIKGPMLFWLQGRRFYALKLWMTKSLFKKFF